MLEPVLPLLQVTVPTQTVAVNVTLLPAVTSVELAERLSTGWGKTVTVPTADDVEVAVVHVAV